MKKSSAQKVESPPQLRDARIKELGDWRGKTLSRLRALIKQAEPEVVEEWKWRKPSNPEVPVWSHQGPICIGETLAAHADWSDEAREREATAETALLDRARELAA